MRNKILTFLKFTFTLALIGGIVYILTLNPFGTEFRSAYEHYERKLLFSKYSRADKEAWKSAAAAALRDSLSIQAPIQVNVESKADKFTAWAYRFAVNEGEKVVLTIDKVIDAELFADVFYIESDFTLSHEKSINTDSADIPILTTGEYLLRVQSPIDKPVGAKIDLITRPIYDVFPVAGKGNKAIQSFWGAPRDGGRRKHEGIDIFAPRGTPLLAVCDGEIDRVRESGRGGKTVWLYDPELNQSIYYAHLDDYAVEPGDRVLAGDTIGTVGNTGNARTTPPHLHLGIYPRGAVDPLPYVKRQTAESEPPRYAGEVGKTGIIEAKPARMYYAPDRTAKAKAILVKGTVIEIIGAADDFLHIKTGQNQSYFALKSDVLTGEL